MHSPLKDPRTRLAGQSLSEQLDQIIDDQKEEIIAPLFIWAIFFIELFRRFLPGNPSLWAYLALAAFFTARALWRIKKLWATRRKIEKGLAGEQILGKFLEEHLMPYKYQVIHDLVCRDGERKFNIDHVVVGPTGIFSIETKYWKRPAGPNHQISYDGKKILVDGRAPEHDPLVQAVAGAKTVQAILETRTGKRFDVKPIVVFLGWYTTTNPGATPAWVLNEQAVPSFILHDFRELPHADGMLAIAQLKQYSAECGKADSPN